MSGLDLSRDVGAAELLAAQSVITYRGRRATPKHRRDREDYCKSANEYRDHPHLNLVPRDPLQPLLADRIVKRQHGDYVTAQYDIARLRDLVPGRVASAVVCYSVNHSSPRQSRPGAVSMARPSRRTVSRLHGFLRLPHPQPAPQPAPSVALAPARP